MNNKQQSARTTLAYGIAGLLALSAALISALGVSFQGRDASSVAYVNGVPILQAEYARAIDAMQSGLDRPLTIDDRERALQILIDEELIVQEALRLNMASDDRLIRKNLVQALIASVTSLNAPVDATEDELRAFYEQEIALFTAPKLYTVIAARADNEETAQLFQQSLHNGAAFHEAYELAGLEPVSVPSLLPIGKLGDYLGGTASETISKMAAGDIAGPIQIDGGALFIWLQSIESDEISFEKAKTLVESEWSRRKNEDAFEKYLEQLRRQARIQKTEQYKIDP